MMGYACPVCEEPQVDAEHLANHMAFTAILRGADHEDWLDEHVPEWGQQSPESLGPVVAADAEEVELDIDDADLEPRRRPSSGPQVEVDREALSESDLAVLQDARDLTRQMLEERGPEDEE